MHHRKKRKRKMADDDEFALEGILKQVIMDHRDDEIDGVLVFVFVDGEASVYNSGIKQGVVDKLADLLATQH
jgi:hypothetical protein